MTATTTARCIAVRTIPSGSGFGSPMAPALYIAHKRADGVWTWRKDSGRPLLGYMYGRDGRAREIGVYSAKKAKVIAREWAERLDCKVGRGVRHGTPLTAAEIAAFGLEA
jgi:hypothetical protein